MKTDSYPSHFTFVYAFFGFAGFTRSTELSRYFVLFSCVGPSRNPANVWSVGSDFLKCFPAQSGHALHSLLLDHTDELFRHIRVAVELIWFKHARDHTRVETVRTNSASMTALPRCVCKRLAFDPVAIVHMVPCDVLTHGS